MTVLNWLPFHREWKIKLFRKNETTPPGKDDAHGGAQETAQMMWQYPNLVDREWLKDYVMDIPSTRVPFGEPMGLGGSVYAPPKITNHDPKFPGFVGYPSVATPELGDQIYESIGGWLAQAIKEHCF